MVQLSKLLYTLNVDIIHHLLLRFLLIFIWMIVISGNMHPCTLTSGNHVVIIWNQQSTTEALEPYLFVYNLFSPSHIDDDLIVDCIHIIDKNDTNYVTKTHTNCLRTPCTTNILQTYPIRDNYMSEIMQTSFNLFAQYHNTNKTLLLFHDPSIMHVHHIKICQEIMMIHNQNTHRIHDMPAIQDDIFGDTHCYVPLRRTLLQVTPSMSPSTYKPTPEPGAPPTTIIPTPESTVSPTSHPSIATDSPTAITNSPTKATNAPTIATNSPTDATNTPTAFTNAPTMTTDSPTDATNSPTTFTNSPSFATNSPTFATVFPTNTPTTFTANPTQSPSRTTPTISPTLNPSNDPSQFTQPPSVNPSVSPTFNPSSAPYMNPTQSPTKAPSNNPSITPSESSTGSPSANPVIAPINQPTISPTAEPTDKPTKNPTIRTFTPSLSPTLCGDICNILNVTLVDINETYMECIKRVASDSDSYEDSKPTLPPKTKNIGNYWKTKALSSDSSESKDSRRRLRWNKDSSSSSSAGSSSTIHRCGESSSSESSESDSADIDFIPIQMCATYKIHYFDPKCAGLKSILLPLCKNNAILNADQLNNLIISISPDTLTVKGVNTYDGTVGILVSFTNVQTVITHFELCLRNVSAMSSAADSAILQIDDSFGICQNSDGLPCLNLDFVDISADHNMKFTDDDALIVHHMYGIKLCDCKTGVISLNVRYEGTQTAKVIQFRYNRSPTSVLCQFEDINPGDILSCASSHKSGKFGYKTFIDIIHNNDDECHGKLWTNCIVNKRANSILNRMDAGCDELRTIGWIDENEAICDETVVLENHIISGNNYNALMNGGTQIESNGDAIRVFDAMDISLQAALLFIGVGIMCGLLWVGSISLFTLYYHCKDADTVAVAADDAEDADVTHLNHVIHKKKHKRHKKDIVEIEEYQYEEECDGYRMEERETENVSEIYQESMKRHQFNDSDYMRDRHIVDLPTHKQQPQIDAIHPNRLYHMARIFSNSDSEHK